MKWKPLVVDCLLARTGLTGINPVQVIQIRSKAQSFNSPINILLNMGCRIGDRIAAPKDIKTTFGGNENLLADVVLPDKLTQQLFIHTSLIDHLCP